MWWLGWGVGGGGARGSAPRIIIDAHIDAIRAVVRDQVKTDENPTGRILAESLEAKVAEHKAR